MDVFVNHQFLDPWNNDFAFLYYFIFDYFDSLYFFYLFPSLNKFCLCFVYVKFCLCVVNNFRKC